MHDLVSDAERAKSDFKLRLTLLRRIQSLLQSRVHILHAYDALFHRTEQLYVRRRDARVCGDPARDHVHDRTKYLVRIGLIVEKEIPTAVVYHGHFAGVDAVGVLDDKAVLALPVNVGEITDRDLAAGDEIRKHVARSDRGKLILVAHHDKPAAEFDRLDERVEDVIVAHTDLVHDDDVLVQFCGFVEQEFTLPVREIEIEKPVYGLCLHARRFGEPFRRSARGRAQTYAVIAAAQKVDYAFDDRRLACSRAARNDRHAFFQTAAHRLRLRRMQFDIVQFFVKFYLFVRIERQTLGAAQHRLNERRYRLLANVIAGEHIDLFAVFFQSYDLARDLAVLHHFGNEFGAVRPLQAQKLVDLIHYVVFGEIGVPVLVRRLFEHVHDRRSHAETAVGSYPYGGRDLVRRQKAHSVYVIDELVRIVLDDAAGTLVVSLEYLDGEIERNSVILQIHYRILHLFEPYHRFLYRESLFERDTFDGSELLRRIFDDVEGLFSEFLDNRIRGDLAHALKKSAG